MTLLLVCFSFATCYAIPFSEISLGGIKLGMSRQDVKDIYGEPNEISHRIAVTGNEVEDWQYGDDFDITFYNDVVDAVSTHGKNGIKSPSGFTCGSFSFWDVRSYYEDKYGEYPHASYDISGNMFYECDNPIISRIEFKFNNDKIRRITIYKVYY